MTTQEREVCERIISEIHEWLVDEWDDEEAFIGFIGRGTDRLVEKDGDLVWEPSDADYIRICTGNAEAQFYLSYADLLNAPRGQVVKATCDEVDRWYKEQE
jgi:hypothetical protein